MEMVMEDQGFVRAQVSKQARRIPVSIFYSQKLILSQVLDLNIKLDLFLIINVLENEICYGATHQEMTGSGVREVEITTYSGATELEKDISCCTKCNKRGDCEYWVRATDSNECWLKSNDGNEIQEVTSNTRRGGLKTKGSLHSYLYLSRYHIKLSLI